MGANEPKKKKRRVGKHFRPRLPRQKPRPVKLRPLTPWERDMAEEHHALVLRFLQVHGLSMEEVSHTRRSISFQIPSRSSTSAAPSSYSPSFARFVSSPASTCQQEHTATSA